MSEIGVDEDDDVEDDDEVEHETALISVGPPQAGKIWEVSIYVSLHL